MVVQQLYAAGEKRDKSVLRSARHSKIGLTKSRVFHLEFANRVMKKLMLTILATWICLSAASGNDLPARTIRVAAVSFVPQQYHLQDNANQLEKMFRLAAEGGAKIAVAPEGALDGYVINEIIAGKIKEERIKEVAITLDSPVMKRFKALARELKMCLVFGLAERMGDDVFNCAVFLDDQGTICGKYHKMQFSEGYHPSWWFNRLGKQSRAFATPYGRCGIMICNDRWNAQLAKIPALDGAQFLVIPSYGSKSQAQDEAVLNRGRENNLPVIEANVGVTLIVDNNEIVAMDRENEGVTFAEMTIPPSKPIDTQQRDRVEQAFLQWRKHEMQRRYKETRRRNQEKKSP